LARDGKGKGRPKTGEQKTEDRKWEERKEIAFGLLISANL